MKSIALITIFTGIFFHSAIAADEILGQATDTFCSELGVEREALEAVDLTKRFNTLCVGVEARYPTVSESVHQEVCSHLANFDVPTDELAVLNCGLESNFSHLAQFIPQMSHDLFVGHWAVHYGFLFLHEERYMKLPEKEKKFVCALLAVIYHNRMPRLLITKVIECTMRPNELGLAIMKDGCEIYTTIVRFLGALTKHEISDAARNSLMTQHATMHLGELFRISPIMWQCTFALGSWKPIKQLLVPFEHACVQELCSADIR